MLHSVRTKVEGHLPMVLNDCAAYGLAVFFLRHRKGIILCLKEVADRIFLLDSLTSFKL